MAGQTKYITTLASPLSAGATSMVVATAPTETSGSLKITQGNTEEWVYYTGVSGTTLTGLTRSVSKTAATLTSTGSGNSFIAGTEVKMVLMHWQLVDKTEATQILQEGKTYATTAARDSALGADGAATKAYTDIYVTATGLFYNYNLSTNQWESLDTGTTTPNASTTVAGKLEVATPTQSINATDTGETGALLSVLPSDIAANTQSGTFVYAADAEASDAYVISLTPALTAYTTGQTISFSPNTTNTGACTINIDGLGAIDIKTKSGSNPPNGYLVSGRIYDLKYDGTNFVIQEYSSTFGGDSSDGVQGDSDLTITGSNNTYIVKNFSSWTAGSVARTCTVTPTNCVVHIKINGDADFTNWTFDFEGKGGQGSTGTRRADNTEGGKGYGIVTCDGGAGGYPNTVNGSFVAHDGYGAAGAQEHGQSFILDSASAGTTSPRFGISRSPQIHPEFIKASKSIIVCCGGGGSGGISSSTVGGENGGNGGHGGGCIIIEVTGNITFSSTTINVNGTAGTTANSATGGGGGGGSIVVICGGTVTGSPTTDVTGADTGDRAGGVGVYALISNDLLF